jgi:uncharacterized delta-60 repeat protein
MRTSIEKREHSAGVRLAQAGPWRGRGFQSFGGRQALALLIVAVLASSNFLLGVAAANGDLDPTFELDGKLTTDFFGQSDIGNDLTVQSDGRIIVAGRIETANGVGDFGLARYESTGAPDATFGVGGKVSTDFFGFNDACFAVALQSDGKIIAGGGAFADSGNGSNNFALARYNSDGSLDAGFGNGGLVSTDLGGGINDEALDVVIQDDGKIVALVGRAAFTNSDFILVRYNSDGTPDPVFGGGFPVTTDFFGGDDFPSSLALQSDGKIVAAGGVEGGIGGFDFGISRYNSDGSPDAAFGVGGIVTTDFLEGNDGAHSVLVQSDGKIIAAGLANEDFGFDDGYFAVARYNGDGGPDASFGIGGKVTTDFPGFVVGIGDVTLACDGKIVAAGSVVVAGSIDASVVRYNSDGSVDAGFGNGGVVNTDFFGGDDFIRCVDIQSDGKIVISGTALTGSSFDSAEFALARYESEPCLTAPCPNPQGYWKNNPAAWPVNSLTLGTQSYTQTELLAILDIPTNGDASLILAKQLITAKLNVANGSDPVPASNAISSGDSLFTGFNGKLPYKIKPSSATGQAMTATAGVLEIYNGGLMTPGCAP